jgi:hypothetical protein
MVFDADRVYGFGREPGLFVWSHVLENHLFCSAIQADTDAIEKVSQWSQKAGRDAVFNRRFTRNAALKDRLAPKLHWSIKHPPLHVRAMVLAGDALFIAGPPDVLSEDDAFNRPNDPQVKAKIAEQDAAYDGKHGALLVGLSTAGGKRSFQLNLSAQPVWDGMAVAEGRLFVCRQDGRLSCLGAE